MTPRHLHPVDRVAIAALSVALLGAGLFLIGIPDRPTVVHALVGSIGIILALPAAVTAGSGRLVPLSDEGVLVSGGVLTFMVLEVVFTYDVAPLRVVGLTLLLSAAAAGTFALYFRVRRLLRRSELPGGRHAV